jgi:hypothetical protein
MTTVMGREESSSAVASRPAAVMTSTAAKIVDAFNMAPPVRQGVREQSGKNAPDVLACLRWRR